MDSTYTRSPSEAELASGVRRPSEEDIESPETKRRKVRKGTRSCWECKRRKIRCNFNSAADAVCIGCQRRGTHCLSQEYPEEASRPAERGQQIGDRIVRVEALVEQLVRKVGNPSPPDSHASPVTTTIASSPKATPLGREGLVPFEPQPALPTPCPSDVEPSQFGSYCNASTAESNAIAACVIPSPLPVGRPDPRHKLPPKLQKLSSELYAEIPPPDVVEFICQSVSGFSIYFHQMMTRSTCQFNVDSAAPEHSAQLPPRDAHPMILAKYLLNLADYLQYMPHDQTIVGRLPETPRAMMKRLTEAAIKVTTDEELMGTLESLECIILEGAYQANRGNLRRAWLAFRRAMVVGQLMGIHRKTVPSVKKLDPSTKADPKFIWYRIQFADRYLGLMLGLPAGSMDNSFASDAALANEPPMNHLERRMCVIASRILERNEAAPDKCNYPETQAIDLELQKAAKLMPSKWWLPPNLSQMAQDPDQASLFWETLRLLNQILYYNLLNQLHLPYMLLFNSRRETVYSKIACVNASREVLSRFIAFRTWNKVAFCCRSVDFFALMAAMTLVLAHLHANDEPDLNTLAHQRHSDRAMMEQVLESMEMVYKLNMDVLSQKSSDLLRRLLEIEADAAEGRRYDTRNMLDSVDCTEKPDRCAEADENGALHSHPASDTDEPGVLRMCIPYFGVIRIAREGGISREPDNTAVDLSATVAQQPLGIVGVGDNCDSTPSSSMPAACNDYCPIEQQGVMNLSKYGVATNHQSKQQQQQQPDAGHAAGGGQNMLHLHEHPQPDFASGTEYGAGLVDDSALQYQQFPYPGLAASADDWAFQGVDMAFFDSLMRGVDANNLSNSTAAVVPESPPPVQQQQQQGQVDAGGSIYGVTMNGYRTLERWSGDYGVKS